MGKRLKGKGAVVTGGGRGIGRELCLALAAEGASVIVVDPGVSRGGEGSDDAPADEVVAEIKKSGGTAIADHHSVTDYNAAEGIINSCVENFGHIDILVNCAGVVRERMVWNLSEEDWDIVMATHLKGTFNCTKWAATHMRQQRSGRIITFPSPVWRGTTGQANYSAAKGGIVSFTKSIALELGRYGITCNGVIPTAATRMILDESIKAGFDKRLEAGLMSKKEYDEVMSMPGPEFVPPIVIYLCTDEAADINGCLFNIMKGRIGIYADPQEVRQMFNDGEIWNVDKLIELIPKTLLVDYINPAPPEKPKE